MIPLQIISLIFGLYMFYWSFLSYKKRLIFINEFLFWMAVWGGFMMIILFPDTIKFFLQTFRIIRVMDLLMIFAFIILWLITFKNYIDNQQLKKKYYDFIRHQAIKKSINLKKKSARK